MKNHILKTQKQNILWGKTHLGLCFVEIRIKL